MSKWRSRKERMKLCKAWQESKLSKAKFCRQNNINIKTFYHWIDSLKEETKTDIAEIKQNVETTPLKFLQINNVSKNNSTFENGFLEVTLPNKINFKFNFPQTAINNFFHEFLKWK